MIFDHIVHKELIKMNSILHFDSFVFMCIISTIINSQILTQTAAKSSKGPGISSCYYFGNLDTACGLPVVPVSSLPKECTAFFMDGVTVNQTHGVYFKGSSVEEGYLDELIQTGKPVYVRFGHANFHEWTEILTSNVCSKVDTCKEMVGLMAFLNKHRGLAGLVLLGLTPDTNDTVSDPDLTKKFKTYITILKTIVKDLQIAISLPGWYLIDYCNDPKIKWFDFSALDSVVDFYEIFQGCVEECTPKFRNIGAGPVTGNSPYTLEKIAKYIPKMNISNDKVHFLHGLNPNSPDRNIMGCNTSSERMCTDPKYSKDWCSPTLKVLYDKGVFSNANGKGFIGINADFDDPHGRCGCNSFPSFHALLNGFNSWDLPPPCPKFDRL